MDGFLAFLRLGAYVAGLDLQDRSFNLFVSPPSRHFRAAHHPVAGRLGMFLFLLFGPCLASSRDNCFVEEPLRLAEHRLC